MDNRSEMVGESTSCLERHCDRQSAKHSHHGGRIRPYTTQKATEKALKPCKFRKIPARKAANNEKQRRISAGIALKEKGRPAKNSIVREEDKVAELRYILARKEAKIKSLEMENELMRDFLSLTERK